MKQKCFMQLLFVFVLTVFAIQAYPASINVHWTPTIGGGVSHGTTVSGNIWINLTEAMDSDPMTSQNISFTEGYIQEQSHNAPQIPLSMSQITNLPSCCGTNMMSVSMDPSVIFQLEHNSSYKIYVKARVTGLRMGMPPEPLTPYDVEQTAYVTGNNLLITQAPDYIISWDPATMTGVNLSATTTDAQTGQQQYKYTISGAGGTIEKTFTNQSRPGTHSFTWDGKNSLGTLMPKGLYSVKVNVYANTPTTSGDCNRSSYLSIESFDYDFYGYSGTIQDGYYKYRINYCLSDISDISAEEGEIWFFYPQSSTSYGHCIYQIEELSIEDGIINHQVISIPRILIDDQTYPNRPRYIALHIKDGHKDEYKNHIGRYVIEPILSISLPPQVPYAYNFDYYDINDTKAPSMPSGSTAMVKQIDIPDGSSYLSFAFTNSNANAPILAANDGAAILFITCHGDIDSIWMNDTSKITALQSANSPPESDYLRYISLYSGGNPPPTQNSFPYLKLAAFVGCKTGIGSITNGCLPVEACNRGSQVSFGFNDILYFRNDGLNIVNTFSSYFWDLATGRDINYTQPQSVYYSWYHAMLKILADNQGIPLGYGSINMQPSNSIAQSVFLAPAGRKE